MGGAAGAESEATPTLNPSPQGGGKGWGAILLTLVSHAAPPRSSPAKAYAAARFRASRALMLSTSALGVAANRVFV